MSTVLWCKRYAVELTCLTSTADHTELLEHAICVLCQSFYVCLEEHCHPSGIAVTLQSFLMAW